MRRTLLLFGLIVGATLLAADVRADRVDDLLSGESISISSETSYEPARKASADDPSAAVTTHAESSVEPAPWEVGIKHPPASELASRGYVSREEPEKVNMVPEPAAIGLAAAALVYFLIFFRRRHFV